MKSKTRNMDKIQALTQLEKLNKEGKKGAELEKLIGLPLNSVSAVLKGKKIMADSWPAKIQSFLAIPGELNSKINFKAPSPEAYDSKKVDFLIADEFLPYTLGEDGKTPIFKSPSDILEPWIQQIRDYCLKNGLQPDQLPGIIDGLKTENKQLIARSITAEHKQAPIFRNLTPPPDQNIERPAGNSYTPMSPFMLEQQKKSQGLK